MNNVTKLSLLFTLFCSSISLQSTDLWQNLQELPNQNQVKLYATSEEKIGHIEQYVILMENAQEKKGKAATDEKWRYFNSIELSVWNALAHEADSFTASIRKLSIENVNMFNKFVRYLNDTYFPHLESTYNEQMQNPNQTGYTFTHYTNMLSALTNCFSPQDTSELVQRTRDQASTLYEKYKYQSDWFLYIKQLNNDLGNAQKTLNNPFVENENSRQWLQYLVFPTNIPFHSLSDGFKTMYEEAKTLYEQICWNVDIQPSYEISPSAPELQEPIFPQLKPVYGEPSEEYQGYPQTGKERIDASEARDGSPVRRYSLSSKIRPQEAIVLTLVATALLYKIGQKTKRFFGRFGRGTQQRLSKG